MDRNRNRTTRALTRAAIATAAVVAGAFGTACTSSQSSPTANVTPPLSSAPSAPASPTPPTPRDAVADCANQIDYWITTEYLQGKPDRGDYQEMGLGSAEGLALRQLERHLAETVKSFPAPAPGNLHQQEIAACDAAGAASATATGTKAPVWP